MGKKAVGQPVNKSTGKQSGISDELPTLLAYPSILKIEECTNVGVDGMLCYIIEHYGSSGIACLIKRSQAIDKVQIQFGDWSGNIFDLNNKEDPMVELCQILFAEYGSKLIQLMRYTMIPQAIYYFTINADRKFKLADVRISYNKFLGPGMLRDVFANIIAIPKVLSIEGFSPAVKDALIAGNGKYACDIIIKPSRFRTVSWNKAINPLYVEIIR